MNVLDINSVVIIRRFVKNRMDQLDNIHDTFVFVKLDQTKASCRSAKEQKCVVSIVSCFSGHVALFMFGNSAF